MWGRKISKYLVLAVLLVVMQMGCTTVPYTGRRQLSLVSEGQEVSMGYQAFRQIQRRYPVSHDPELNARVQRVGQRIAAAANRPDYRWEFVVFREDKIANAFCLPGGKVGIFTGLFKYIKSDADLATVISHEAAHVLARHAGERYSQGMLAELGGVGLSGALRGMNPYAGQAIMTGYQLGATVGFLLPYSRAQETEADRIGLILMAKAGYDPALALEFWQRWSGEKKEKGSANDIFSTHPSDAKRLLALKQYLPEAKRYYQP